MTLRRRDAMMKKAKMLKTDEAKAKLAQAEKDFEGDHLKKWRENRCVACGGKRMAGDGPGTLLTTKDLKESPSDLRKARATWIRPDGKEVVTVCNDSKCRKAILPTGEQLAVMEAEGLKNVKEEAELRMRHGV